MVRRQLTSRFSLKLLAGVGLSTLALVACSAAGGGSQFSGTSSGSGGSNGAGHPSTSGTDGTGGGFLAGSGAGQGGDGQGGGCASTSSKAELLPLDIFIMLDQSGSMSDPVAGGGTKWTAVTKALAAFVNQPNQAGVAVGIQYFGLPPPGGFGDSCNAVDYANAEVEIAPLPGVAGAITTSLSKHSPTTSTPTSAALQGAINHAQAWQKAHATHLTIVVFATDGDPTECDTNLGNIDAIAAAGFGGMPKIITFVIGVGPSLGALDGIALAGGGTPMAFHVDTNGNANQQFLDAMNKIRGSVLACSYLIPKPAMGMIDFTSVNVQYKPSGGGAPVIIPKVASKAACPASGNAWYYDNDAAPTQIVLCDATCADLSKDVKGEVDILLGCKSVVK